MVTAVTGDIGSGKSTAARILAKFLGCECVDADVIAKDLWTRDDVKSQAVRRWSSEILDSSGQIITSKIAERIFSAKSDYDFCNGLIHPLVMSQLYEIACGRNSVVLEIPLLPEAGRPSWVDRAVYVTAEFSLRAERCKRQRGWSCDELRRRESFLLPKSVRMSVCEYVIINDDGIDELTQKLAVQCENY